MKPMTYLHQSVIFTILSSLLLFIPVSSNASRYLLFGEAQGVAGYDSNSKYLIYNSHHQHYVMQKPSLGFDYLQRIGTQDTDFALLAIQARLAYDYTETNNLETQLYNAYLKIKTPVSDIWMGHNKPAVGLSSYLDNHGSLLYDLSMVGFGYDRDWGVGLEKTFEFWNYKLSATTGSGMSLQTDGSYLLAGRVAIGDLSKENYTVGLTALKGKVLESMGYQIMHNDIKHEELMLGADLGIRYLNYELKTDLLGGSFYHKNAYAALVRASWFPGSEDRLGIESQIILRQLVGKTSQNFALGTTYRFTPELDLKTMYDYDSSTRASKLILQVYYYKNLSLF